MKDAKGHGSDPHSVVMRRNGVDKHMGGPYTKAQAKFIAASANRTHFGDGKFAAKSDADVAHELAGGHPKSAPTPVHPAMSPTTHDVGTISEYGLTQKLSRPVRVY